MRTGTTVGAFAAGLGVVFAAAFGVGRAVGPIGTAGDHQSQGPVAPATQPQHTPQGPENH